ncbi:hypothetical protein ABIE09_000391 [Lysobacter enzymogenes]|uniref:hypothetical protein n=1 Tax=Lysobacter enzymogenes TaxID=69 RepID=UPI003399C841
MNPRVPPAWARGYLGAALLGAYALAAWLSIRGVESPDPALSGKSAPLLGAISVALAAAYAVRYWAWLSERFDGRIYRLAMAVVAVGGVFYVASQWWCVRLNAIGGADKVYAGTVASKQTLSRRRGAGQPVLHIVESGTGRRIGFIVPQALYAQAAVGDGLRCDYRVGWLGSPYRRRSAALAPACGLDRAASG